MDAAFPTSMIKRFFQPRLFVSLLLLVTLVAGCGSQSTGAGGNGTGTGATEGGGDNGSGDETPVDDPGAVGSASCAELYANYPLTLISGTTTRNEAWPAVAKPVRGVAMREETYGSFVGGELAPACAALVFHRL